MALLQALSGSFTRPSFESFLTLLQGWLLVVFVNLCTFQKHLSNVRKLTDTTPQRSVVPSFCPEPCPSARSSLPSIFPLHPPLKGSILLGIRRTSPTGDRTGRPPRAAIPKNARRGNREKGVILWDSLIGTEIYEVLRICV
jgi:hypothetical protein